MGAAIASVLADSNINSLVQTGSGTSAYLPLIEFGELDFGFANAIEASESHKGEEAFAPAEAEEAFHANLNLLDMVA